LNGILQFQLILGDYFTENKEAAKTAEEATDLIGWVLNHGLVRSVFNETQAEISSPPGKILAFLVANMTRWNTHFIAFDRLHNLKDPMRRAVISRRQDIVAGQVGAEKNCQKRQKLEDNAIAHCELIDDGGFWHCLKSVVDDLEPIWLGLNMNQMDAMHPDQALLTFAGIFLYFQKHAKLSVATGMAKRIEKRWKALDQPMFVLALVLNPFEGLSRFGDKAAVSPFTLHSILLEVRMFSFIYTISLTAYTTMHRPTDIFILDPPRHLVPKMRSSNLKLCRHRKRKKFPEHSSATLAQRVFLRIGKRTRRAFSMYMLVIHPIFIAI